MYAAYLYCFILPHYFAFKLFYSFSAREISNWTTLSVAEMNESLAFQVGGASNLRQ
jgi:hypothetical protein